MCLCALSLQWIDTANSGDFLGSGDLLCEHGLTVCSCGSKVQTNWMITNYINISRTDITELVLNVTLAKSATCMCDDAHNCNQAVRIRIFETSEPNETNRLSNTSYSVDLANVSTMKKSVKIPVSAAFTGLYLAVVDTPPGACLTITRLVLYYYIFPEEVVNGKHLKSLSYSLYMFLT